MAYATSTFSPFAGLMARISEFAEQFRQNAARRRTYRETYNSLSVLSDRDLADIGLSRSMIADVARQSIDA